MRRIGKIGFQNRVWANTALARWIIKPTSRAILMTSTSLSTKKTWLLILAISPLIWFCLFFLFHFLVLSPITEPMQSKLENVFQQIPLPAQTKLQDYRAVHKPDEVFVTTHYDTQLQYSEIFSFYDDELLKQGWQFAAQRDITLNAIGRDYCRNDYVFSVNYYGIGNDPRLELWLGWGTPGCPVVKGGMYQLISIINNCFLLFASLSWIVPAIILGFHSWTKSRVGFSEFALDWGTSPNPRTWRVRIASLVIIALCLLGIFAGGSGIIRLLI